MGKRKETDIGKANESGIEKEEPFVEQEKAVAEVEIEDGKGEEVEIEKPEENQENTLARLLSLGCGSDLKGIEENTDSKGILIQDDNLQPEVPPTRSISRTHFFQHRRSPSLSNSAFTSSSPRTKIIICPRPRKSRNPDPTDHVRSHFPNPLPLSATENSLSYPRILWHWCLQKQH